MVAAGFDLTLELADAPVLRFGFLEIVETRLGVLLSHNQAIMTPGQKATQCVAFFPVRECEVEFPEILEVGEREALAKFGGESAGKFWKQPIAVCGFRRSSLFLFHDPSADCQKVWIAYVFY